MTDILNTKLLWDGTHLGQHPDTKISNNWVCGGVEYTTITVTFGWFRDLPGGNIHCILISGDNLFPCIVEEIKSIFGVHKRGIHRITIGYFEYIMFYVPVNINNELLWETPIIKLDNDHILRHTETFKNDVRKALIFCDLLALMNTSEHSIVIRPRYNNQYIPIVTNIKDSTFKRSVTYNCSLVTGAMHNKWFKEDIFPADVAKIMVQHHGDDIGNVTTKIRGYIDDIIRRYDRNYIWFSTFIVDRLSRYLLQ